MKRLMTDWRVVNAYDPDRWIVLRPLEFDRCTAHDLRIWEVVDVSEKTAGLWGHYRGEVAHWDAYSEVDGGFAIYGPCETEDEDELEASLVGKKRSCED